MSSTGFFLADYALERGVARLVDLVCHGDDRGQGRLDHLGRDVTVATDRHRAVLTVTSEAKVTCGSPSRSASIAGITDIVPSVEAMPSSTRSTSPTLAIAFASTSDVAGASEPRSPRRVTCTPLSAPDLQGLLDRVTRLGGPHGQDRHLLRMTGVFELQGLFDGILVELGEQPIHGNAIRGVVLGLERAVRLGVWHVLTQTTIFMCALSKSGSNA